MLLCVKYGDNGGRCCDYTAVENIAATSGLASRSVSIVRFSWDHTTVRAGSMATTAVDSIATINAVGSARVFLFASWSYLLLLCAA